ncbi:tetratricopeptide repeat-containing sulfotransferase family protein [Wenzhouxiangella marina]|uniref:Putative sulfotransferase n=1 Tax=Wenzhouxiangella marina TaxID=1579979 RepID=A0A0K0XTX2_9GAMM|nr:tetratricopeptide repeat-containing sulfotransferase family protein [Wenzhouxiangella marina]AKS41072.1 Putative sulfotransferase [Wenzhouxiangella marina]MBB6087950.1 tetratricopeptide (TPR) repeat protein [Wenzhouxiangella marina]
MDSPTSTFESSLVRALQQGRAAEALALCNQGLGSRPGDHRLLHWRGLARLQLGELKGAEGDLRQAIKQAPDRAHYHSNLGEALRRQGRVEEGVAAVRQALAIQPDLRSARINLAVGLLKLEQPDEALQAMAGLEPVDAQLLALRADAERQRARPSQAVGLYLKALELDPDHVHSHSNLGPLLIAQGRWDDALAHCQRAVELAPDQALPLSNLGRCHAALDQLEEAMDCYARAVELEPPSATLATNIAEVWLDMAELEEAQLWLERALASEPEDVRAQATLARVWIQDERAGEARQLLDALHQRHPDHFELHSVSAQAAWEEGDIEAALGHHEQAAALRPQHAATQANIGRVLASAGRVEEARLRYERALAINPRCIPALNGLAYSQRGDLDSTWVEQLESMLNDKALRSGGLSSVHGALGYVFDGRKDYRRAAEHIEQSNRLQWEHRSRRDWNYRPEHYTRQVDRLIQRFDRELILDRMAIGHDSEVPVFVVGMPRSGTTLTEQVLAAHPQVAGVGERHFATRGFQHLPDVMGRNATPDECLPEATAADLRQCGDWHLQQLINASGRSDALRIVDKMPDNSSQVGWILSLFPNARVVYVRRDPRDIAVSCWMTGFAQIQWACHQEHIARRLIDHRRLMDHWLTIMPERVRVQDYEALVADPEAQIRSLIDWLGLDWHPDCLQFHQARSVVRTASVNQVRQPIYKRSVKRWEAYSDALGPLFQALAESDLIPTPGS